MYLNGFEKFKRINYLNAKYSCGVRLSKGFSSEASVGYGLANFAVSDAFTTWSVTWSKYSWVAPTSLTGLLGIAESITLRKGSSMELVPIKYVYKFFNSPRGRISSANSSSHFLLDYLMTDKFVDNRQMEIVVICRRQRGYRQIDKH